MGVIAAELLSRFPDPSPEEAEMIGFAARFAATIYIVNEPESPGWQGADRAAVTAKATRALAQIICRLGIERVAGTLAGTLCGAALVDGQTKLLARPVEGNA